MDLETLFPRKPLPLPGDHPAFGAARSAHGARPKRIVASWVIGIAIVGKGLFDLFEQWLANGCAVDDAHCGRHVALAAVGLVVLLYAIVAGSDRLVVYERGFVWTRRLLPDRTIAWSDVRDAVHMIVQRERSGRSEYIELSMNDGGVMTIPDSFEALRTITDHAKGCVGMTAAQQIARTLRAGASTRLGALTLTPHGIELRGRTLAWLQIVGAERSGADVALDVQGPPPYRAMLSSADVRDADVLLELIAMARAAA